VHDNVPQNNSDVNLCLFRIVQEALQNIVKHSGAREARVTLVGREQQILLSIEDSGIGFNSTNSQRTETLGLVSMRERVRLVDGQISIQSEPAKGTRIDVQVPCKPQASI
jgi:signal transduction histidine kinase